MNYISILAEEVMPGDFLVARSIPMRVLHIEDEGSMISIILYDGTEVRYDRASRVRVLDDAPEEDERAASHKLRMDE